jgi:hypothetical protein
MTEAAAISRDEMAAIVRRLAIRGADDAFIARAAELGTLTLAQVARLPVLPKNAEPAHVFSVPLR